jgi:hypothetical protein
MLDQFLPPIPTLPAIEEFNLKRLLNCHCLQNVMIACSGHFRYAARLSAENLTGSMKEIFAKKVRKQVITVRYI